MAIKDRVNEYFNRAFGDLNFSTVLVTYFKDGWNAKDNVCVFCFNIYELMIGVYRNERHASYLDFFPKQKDLKIFHVSKIMGYEVLNNEQVIERKQGSFGKAIAGGLLFGGVGALAGSLSSGGKQSTSIKKSDYKVRILIDDINLALIDIPCESDEIAFKLLQMLQIIEKDFAVKSDKSPSTQDNKVANKQLNAENQSAKSYYDELVKLKTLVDSGVITLDEFNKLKQKLISD